MADHFSLAYRRWRDAEAELLLAHQRCQDASLRGKSARAAADEVALLAAMIEITTVRFREMVAATQDLGWSLREEVDRKCDHR